MACQPSSGPLGWPVVPLARRRQGASVVPFRGLGVHLDVARSSGGLSGGLGGTRVVPCLGGQETAGSSSLLGCGITTKRGLHDGRSWWRQEVGGEQMGERD